MAPGAGEFAGFAALKHRLASRLPEGRWRHTQGVAEMAVRLAERWGLDPGKAALAGLLHDCAKSLPSRGLQARLKASGADALERGIPGLWHAPVGAWLARTRYGCKDASVLQAIRHHSSGHPGMGPLGRVLFVADYIEPNRSFSGLDRLRRLAFRDFDAAFKAVVASKISLLLKGGRLIHPNSVKLWNSLVEGRG